jgi:hypothetical protein
MFVVFALIDGHFLLTLELEIIDGEQRVCHPKMWARHFVGKIFVFIDALKYSAVPFCILLLLSILIIHRVFQAQGISEKLQNLRQLHNYRQYSLTSSPTITGRSSSVPMNSSHSNSVNNTRVGRRVTFMLLSVSIAFCVFSAPMSLMQIVQSISKPGYNETPLAIGKAIAELCQYINHSCNFFLYALTGRIFRREFVRLFFPTRFGGGRTAGGAARLGHNGRASLIPQAGHISSRNGSLYSIENNQLSLYRTSRRLTTFYLKQYNNQTNKQHNRSHTVKSPLLFDNNNDSLSINKYHYKNYDKSSIATMRNPSDNSPLYVLWRNMMKRKERRETCDGPLLFVNILKPTNSKPCSV